MKAEASGTTDPGETTNEVTNEDFLWLGPEDDVKTVLILDGTSGTTDDFGAEKEKTGGRLYVETVGNSIRQQLTENPGKDLAETVKTSISEAWGFFQRKGKEEREKYFSGEKEASTFPTATTAPGAVGSLVRWNEEKIEVLHIGDVETYIVKNNGGLDLLTNKVHQRFDEIMNEKITELREKGVEDPSERPEVWELCNNHRSASNLPGTYPQIMFNPIVVDKQAEEKVYEREEVKKILLSTDGAAPRMKNLWSLDNTGILDFVEENGVEASVEKLRVSESEIEVDELKNSDDATLAVIKFQRPEKVS